MGFACIIRNGCVGDSDGIDGMMGIVYTCDGVEYRGVAVYRFKVRLVGLGYFHRVDGGCGESFSFEEKNVFSIFIAHGQLKTVRVD